MEAHLQTLHLREPFRIAHGTSHTRTVLRVTHNGAVGEAPFVPYYGECPEESLRWVQSLSSLTDAVPENAPRAVRLALDLLRLDAQGRRFKTSLGALFDIPFSQPLPAARSLSIPRSLDELTQKISTASAQFSRFKLKLGSGSVAFDLALVEHAKNTAPHALFFADANGGWSLAEALEILPRLKRLGLAFVEQPVAHTEGPHAWRTLHEQLGTGAPPLYADESVHGAGDIEEIGEWIAGVNVKLLKCGTFAAAVDCIRAARARGLCVLLGCMIESSIGTSAASHLAPLADWIDLDGHLWLQNDDYEGIQFDSRGMLLPPTLSGIGVLPRKSP